MSADDLTHKLHELHARRERRVTEGRRGPVTSEALASLAILEQVQARLADCLQSLHETLPSLQPVRRMDSGAWRLGLAQPLDPEQRKGRASRPYSRCEFTLEIDMVRRQIHLACHATVFDRDLPTEHLRLGTDELPWAELQDFIEAASLHFAERWFAQPPRLLATAKVSAPAAAQAEDAGSLEARF